MPDDQGFIVGDERRRLESRLSRMEAAFSQLDKRIALAERDIAQVVSTMQSRYEALHGGQLQILSRIDALVAPQTLHEWRQDINGLEARTKALEQIRDRLDGAYVFVRLMGIGGIIGGIIALVKLVRGTP